MDSFIRNSVQKQKTNYETTKTTKLLRTTKKRGSAVEHQSLASVLSPSCARPVAYG